jgi:Methylamine utilisation protein MauE
VLEGLPEFMAYLALACRGVIGLVFAVSAVSKLRSGPAFREFTSWLAGLPLPGLRRRPGLVAAVLAAAETAIVALVALPWTARAGLVLAAAVLAAFTAGTWLAVARGAGRPCQCFGASATPMSRLHVARDLVLCLVAAGGAAAAGAGGTRPAGVALSLMAGLAVALFVVFLDDLAALFSGSGDAGPGLARGDGR